MNKPISYKSAGVDINAGEALVSRIKQATSATKRAEVIGGIGGFSALCKIPSAYKNPVLVSSTDGVGTKLRLALDSARHNTIGQDLVAMCVNDLVVCGAEPLFFLDYYATGKLNVNLAHTVISSIAEGCKMANCSLIGGETAEMPGMYQNSDYDLAGFCVGVVEEEEVIDGKNVAAGDVLIAIPSTGPHSNGYSLIRKILEVNNIDLKTATLNDKLLIDLLLEPTAIYVKPILKLIKETGAVKAIAHITGGGLIDNIPRVLPNDTQAIINKSSFNVPDVFQYLQKLGNVQEMEMFRVFNCGIGMIVCTSPENADKVLKNLQDSNLKPCIIGYIDSSLTKQVVIK